MLAELVTRRRIRFGAAVVAALLTAACAAGQQAQTADESPSLDGTNVDVGHMALRGLAIESPQGIAYKPGESAAIRVVLVNRGNSVDHLTSVSSPAASGWAAYGGNAASTSTTSPANSPAPEVLKPLSSVPIEPGRRVSYGVPEARGTLLLTQIKQAVRPGALVSMTFTFADAGSVDVQVPVELSPNPPTAVLPGPSATGQVG